MGKKGRIISSKVKFNRDREHPEKQIGKPKKSNSYNGAGLDFYSPTTHFGQMKKPAQKGTKGNR